MADFIDIKLKRTAVALADSQDFTSAAVALNTSPAEVKRQIQELEDRLCLNLFVPATDPPILTDEGRFLIHAFREAFGREQPGY